MQDEPTGQASGVTASVTTRDVSPSTGAVPEYLPMRTTQPATAPEVLSAQLGAIMNSLAELRESFDSKLKYDEYKETQIKTMAEEIVRLREGEQFRLLRPLLMDLIYMYDDLSMVLKSAETALGVSGEIGGVLRSLATFQDSILATLARYGVERYEAPGELAIADRQHVIRTTETANPALDRCVADRQKPGFAIDGRVLRPEQVIAYRYVAK